MSGLRQIAGGLLAALLLICTVVSSLIMAFAETGSTASAGSTVTRSPLPATTQPAPPTLKSVSPTHTLVASDTSTPPVPKPAASATTQPTIADTATGAPPTAIIPPTASPQPTVCIPAPPPGWVFYTIQRGDTLFSLSVTWGVSLATLQRVNCIGNPADIKAGQRIYAPPNSAATALPSATPTSSLAPGNEPTITSVPVPSATPDCAPPTFYDPALGRCREPDATATPAPTDPPGPTDTPMPPTETQV